MGKGGGKAKVPYEQPDNLKSRQQLSIIDLLCEGQIEGPVGGLKGVYLNKTPVQAEDGSYNFKGIETQWVAGSQDQDPLSDFTATESEVPVSLEVKKTTPIVRTITDANVDRVRVTVGVNGLYQQNDNGDTVATSVKLLVQVSSGNSWKTAEEVTLSGKVRNQYLRSVMIKNLPEVPFNLRVVRVNEDSKSSRLENRTIWSSYTEIYDVKLTYPNTAVVGLRFDSEQFNGVPKRQYLIKGMMVKIPDNYDPISRTYQGLWTGNFKISWTDNPAWVFYDLVTNNRYGLGERIGPFGCDKFTLYSIAQYCDQLVDDGFGQKEPRFTCNCYITNQRQAYDIINDLCSIFRALPVWNGMQLSAVIDRPADMTYLYTNANVVDGKFNYSSSSLKSRCTAAHIRYVDPDNGWETATEYVADDVLIRRFGLNVKKIDAFGCTSRGQAHRVGQWLLQTSKLEKQTITFAVGREGLRHLPGDIVGIADNDYAGAKIGGRIISVNGNTVTLDRDIDILNIQSAFLSFVDNSGKLEKVKIVSQPKPDTVVLEKEIETKAQSVWMLSTSLAKPRLFKALGISENDDGSYAISALEHIPEKEAIVDNGLQFDKENSTIFGNAIPPVEHLQVDVTPESDIWQAKLSWSTPRYQADMQFEVKIVHEDRVKSRNIVNQTEFYLTSLEQGRYNAFVRGIDKEGKCGDESAVVFSILPPAKPEQLIFTASHSSVTIRPVTNEITSLGTQYEFYKGKTEQEVKDKKYYLGRSMIMTDQDCMPLTEYWYGVNAINSVGRSEMLIGRTKTLVAENGAGGIFRIQNSDGKFPSNDIATQMFLSEFGFYPARDTTLIFYSLDSAGQVNHSEPKMYDGGKWVEPALFLDGDLIATGTMRGDRLIAGTEINAPLIKGGKMMAGSVVSTGTPPAFELLPDGTLNAMKANISGKIKAISGELDNVVINETCTIKKLKVDQIEGDVLRQATLEVNSSIIIPAVDFDRNIISAPLILSVYGTKAECTISANNTKIITLSANGFKAEWSGGGGQGGSTTYTRWPDSDQGMINYTLKKGVSLTLKYECNSKKGSNGKTNISYPQTLYLLLSKSS